MLGTSLSILATALSLLVIDIIFPEVDLANFPAALLAAVAIGTVNYWIRPLLSILSFPLNFFSLGAFSLVVNVSSFWIKFCLKELL